MAVAGERPFGPAIGPWPEHTGRWGIPSVRRIDRRPVPRKVLALVVFRFSLTSAFGEDPRGGEQ